MLARARARVPAVFRPDSVLVKTSRVPAVSVQTKPPCPPRFFRLYIQVHVLFGNSTTDGRTGGRTDGRETRTGRKTRGAPKLESRESRVERRERRMERRDRLLRPRTRSVTHAHTRTRHCTTPPHLRLLLHAWHECFLNISGIMTPPRRNRLGLGSIGRYLPGRSLGGKAR